MKLLLFDIDGTLIDSGGAGTRSLDRAFKELFSIDRAFSTVSMAGKTDLRIIKECLAVHKLTSANGLIPEVIDAYLKYLRIEIENKRRHIKPGIGEILHALSLESGAYCTGLLTGNIERGARIKLEPFSLNGYFPFGAFGSDDEDRNKLLPVALERCAALGKTIGFSDCVIIGDTPKDVECGKPYGAFCIGVATGPYTADLLGRAGADAVFEDLSDTGKVLQTIADL